MPITLLTVSYENGGRVDKGAVWRKIGHFGTGDLEINIKSADDLEQAKPYIVKSYEVS